MTIKQLNKSYLKELVKLNTLAYKTSSKGVREYFAYTFKHGKVFGYFIEERLVGCVGLIVHKKMNYSEIEHLLVHPDFQKQGIGKKLMRFIEKYSKSKLKIKNIRLDVRIKNKKAIKLYKNLGYKEISYTMAKGF